MNIEMLRFMSYTSSLVLNDTYGKYFISHILNCSDDNNPQLKLTTDKIIVKNSDIHGNGVFALKPINRNSVLKI